MGITAEIASWDCNVVIGLPRGRRTGKRAPTALLLGQCALFWGTDMTLLFATAFMMGLIVGFALLAVMLVFYG